MSFAEAENRPGANAVRLGGGTPTGMGSLPFSEPGRAVAAVLELLPELPSSPQLPRRSPRELMLAQGAAGMSGVHIAADGSLYTDTRAIGPVAVSAALQGEAWVSLRAFVQAVAGRAQPVKLQLTGPITLGLALAAAGVPSPLAFTVAGAQVRAQAEALSAMVDKRLPAGALVVLDEPGLSALTSSSYPLPLDATIDLLSGVLAVLGHACLAGVHCCGPTDWQLVLQAGPDLASFPVEYAPEAGVLAGFLERGGLAAWGAVPTDRPIGSDPEPHWRRLSEAWCDAARGGCDPALLRSQALITPACGLGMHGLEQVAHVFALVRGISERVQDQAIAVRLSAGA
ncbi:MAG: hypothetical protein ACR2H3_02610 [Acidimicrobiales bacterium]